MCAKRTSKKNKIAIHIAKTGLYIPVKITRPIKIKLPKIVLKRLTNNAGIANTTSHIITKMVINPITMSAFFSENMLEIEIILIYQQTKIHSNLNTSRPNSPTTPAGDRTKLFNVFDNFHKNRHQTGSANLKQTTKKFACILFIIII